MQIYNPKLIEKKSNEELKKGIIQELRLIMSNSFSLIEDEHRIRKVQISKFLLDERKIGIYDEIDSLESQTGWQFTALLEDCVAYPNKSIYPSKYYSQKTKEESICNICEDYDNRIDNYAIKICDNCLNDCETALINKTVLVECFLFQTPEKNYWCKHANENTLLISTDKYSVAKGLVLCKECIQNEKLKRK